MGWRETQVHIATRDKGDEWKVWARKANDRGISPSLGNRRVFLGK